MSAIASFFIFVASSVLGALLSLGLLAVYGNNLTPEQFGVVSLLTALGIAISNLMVFGLDGAVSRLYFDNDASTNERKSFYSSLLIAWSIVAVIILLVVWIALSAISSYRVLPDLSFYPYYFLVLATALLQSLFAWQVALLIVQKRAVVYAVLTLGQKTAVLVFAYLMLQQNQTVEYQLWAVFLGTGMTSGFLLVTNLYQFVGIPKLRIGLEALHFGFPLLLTVSAGWALRLGDRFILQYYHGAEVVAQYSMAYSLAEILLVLFLATSRVWSPRFIGAETAGRRSSSMYAFAGTAITALGWSAAVSLSLFSLEVLNLVGNNNYFTAVNLMRLILIGVALFSSYYVTGTILYLYKRAGLLAFLTIAAALITFGFDMLLVPDFGALGAALASVLGYIVFATMSLLAANHLYEGRLEYLKVGITTGVGVFACTAPMLMSFTIPLRGLLVVLFCSFASLVVIKSAKKNGVAASSFIPPALRKSLHLSQLGIDTPDVSGID